MTKFNKTTFFLLTVNIWSQRSNSIRGYVHPPMGWWSVTSYLFGLIRATYKFCVPLICMLTFLTLPRNWFGVFRGVTRWLSLPLLYQTGKERGDYRMIVYEFPQPVAIQKVSFRLASEWRPIPSWQQNWRIRASEKVCSVSRVTLLHNLKTLISGSGYCIIRRHHLWL